MDKVKSVGFDENIRTYGKQAVKNPNFKNKVKPKTRVINNINYYDLEQVCKMLGIGERTLRDYIYKDKIKAVKLNNKWYISETAIKEFLNGGVI